MRINIWIVLAVLLALLAITHFARYESDTQRICVDDPSASVSAREDVRTSSLPQDGAQVLGANLNCFESKRWPALKVPPASPG
jgi:hypothetical protein